MKTRMKILTVFLLVVFCIFGTIAGGTAERTVYPDQGSVAVFVEDGKCGLMNAESKVILDAEYDGIEPFDCTDYTVLHRDGRKGIVRSDGTVIIPCNLFSIIRLSGTDLAQIEYDGSDTYNLIDLKTGKILLEDAGSWCKIVSGYYCVEQSDYIKESDYSEIYDRDLHLVLTLPGHVDQIEDGWILMYDSGERCSDLYDMQGCLLYADINFAEIENHRVFCVRYEENEGSNVYYYGIIQPDGSYIEKKADGYTVFRGSSYPYCIYDYDNKKAGFIDDSCKTVLPMEYDDAYCFYEGTAFAKKDGKWMLIDEQGQRIDSLPQDFEPLLISFNWFDTDIPAMPFIPIAIGDDVRLIDRRGDFINDSVYSKEKTDSPELYLDRWLILYDKEGTADIVDIYSGEACCRCPIENWFFTADGNVEGGTLWIKTNGLWGIMDLSAENAGQWIIEPQYLDVDGNHARGWHVNLSDGTGAYIDSRGNITGPAPVINRDEYF